ncbi:hypothetical protein CCR75_002218 [Bremia lactucae]|uniref:Protein-tyrosine-phosphatase n=1 Tax=Bremia lactucae TaxID=4779 RepID=A0A976FPC0_BRELC|nr:hypothetical protein CCR75_002218 [Bremia lactucae]
MNSLPTASPIHGSTTSLQNLLAKKQYDSSSAGSIIDAFMVRLQQLQCRDSHSGVTGFKREYKELCHSIDKAPGYDAALTPQTTARKAKNRYQDVVPFEKTRVKLQLVSRETRDDYINASYIDGGYIACCAPVPAAIGDFWHMVWQCHVHVVLMLTNFVEHERLKAVRYWNPRGYAVTYGNLQVQLLDKKTQIEGLGFIVRRFQLSHKIGLKTESRTLLHLQLTKWPDHGVLRDFRVIASMLDTVNCYRDDASRRLKVEAKVVVHCSAGIGRSGTFIAIDILLKQLHRVLIGRKCETEGTQEIVPLDVSKVVYRLRSQRPGMVQTPEQYQMIYHFLAAVISGNKPW